MSDTDSSEDENSARLLASVDTSFLSDALYKPKEVATKEKGVKESSNTVSESDPIKADAPKSNRYLVEEDAIWKSDLNVPDSMKKHLAGKLSQLIGSMIAFDDVSAGQSTPTAKKRQKEEPAGFGVRLLSSFQECIEPTVNVPFVQSKPTPILRRVIEGETEPNRADKIASSVSSPDNFTEEVRHWKAPKRRSTVFHYTKKGNGVCIEKEHVPPNEFTAARLKNGWDESKIKTFKRKSKNVPQ
uniref:Protein CUSTOS n=1 Tax=Anopheles atroparvus TaxID=41427 RepID=A0A182JF04_ANOAO